MHILAADIGGTNCRLALYQAESPSDFSLLREITYSSDSAESLSVIIARFLSQLTKQPIERACIGIAGPVIAQRCATTNLPWRVSAQEIRQTFDFEQVWLLNDLEANAWGINLLKEQDFWLLNPGREEAEGNRSIISVGTGLGEAGMVYCCDEYRPFASEGGHSDFSPTTSLEFKLHQWLTKQFNHVSWERLVSGPGLESLYTFLLDYHKQQTPAWLSAVVSSKGMAPAISQAALEGRDPLCLEALDLFLLLFGREAGNHALKLMATGGVYLGGGITPRVLNQLKSSRFLDAFFDKGRMRPLMEAMPVRVI
ncbi:MAG: glucokinase, partial [Candidatus Thiodiazotropha sp.]